jgi:hypothetical protein
MMRNKLLLILIAISLYSVQSYAQGIFKATITADGGDIVVKVKADGGDITTGFSQIEFYLRTTDLTTAFATSFTGNPTDFPGPVLEMGPGQPTMDATYRTWWITSPPSTGGAVNIYPDGVEYELARISFDGSPNNDPNNAAVFELVSSLPSYNSYLSIISDGGTDLTAGGCIWTTCPAESFFYGDTAGAGSGLNTTSSTTAVPLPIELGSFTGWAETKTNELKWNTQSEENSATFEIERSIDSENFERLGAVNAAGNSAEAITYGFTDVDPATGVNYYRLKMVDLDGSYEYSNVIQIKRTGKSTIKAFPNPFTKNISIQLAALESGTAQFMVYDITGKQMMVQEIEIQSGVSNVDLKLASLAIGTYIIKALLPGAEVLTTKIIKNN